MKQIDKTRKPQTSFINVYTVHIVFSKNNLFRIIYIYIYSIRLPLYIEFATWKTFNTVQNRAKYRKWKKSFIYIAFVQVITFLNTLDATEPPCWLWRQAVYYSFIVRSTSQIRKYTTHLNIWFNEQQNHEILIPNLLQYNRF